MKKKLSGSSKKSGIILVLAAFFYLFTANICTAAPRGAVESINSNSKFLMYYGNDFSHENKEIMKGFNIIVLNPNQSNCTPQVVKELQDAGVQYVLGYISIGEDFGGVGASPIIGDGKGPVYINPETNELVYQEQGIASFYVDSVYNSTSSQYEHDETPDKNGEFSGWYIFPNSDWRWVINVQRLGGNEGVFNQRINKAGLAQIVGSRNGDLTVRTGNFGFNGFFFDTIDTAGPYTNPGYYPWAAEEMQETVKFIHETYPDQYILANRGIFYYQAGLSNSTYNIRPIDFSIRPYVNGVLFESYFLDSNSSVDGAGGESEFFIDNKNNVAPKLMAEANRLDGFTIFCIDYKEGRDASLYAQLVDETIISNGWVEYLTEHQAIDTINQDIAVQLPIVDNTSPQWTSTAALYNQQVSARTGVQLLTTNEAQDEITVSWDVAKDQSLPVKYNIYLATQEDFSNQVIYNNVSFETGEGWQVDPVNKLANEFKVTNLTPGTYYIKVRAQDSSPDAHEDGNNIVLSINIGVTAVEYSNPSSSIILDGDLSDWAAVVSFPEDPDDVSAAGTQVDWKKVSMAHDNDNIYLAYENRYKYLN
jgi:hypothetical protein